MVVTEEANALNVEKWGGTGLRLWDGDSFDLCHHHTFVLDRNFDSSDLDYIHLLARMNPLRRRNLGRHNYHLPTKAVMVFDHPDCPDYERYLCVSD